MAKNYEEVAEMFKSIANLGTGVHHGALSTTRANSDSRKLYAPNSPDTSESMPYSAWNVVGTFADVAPMSFCSKRLARARFITSRLLQRASRLAQPVATLAEGITPNRKHRFHRRRHTQKGKRP